MDLRKIYVDFVKLVEIRAALYKDKWRNVVNRVQSFEFHNQYT